ncbi:glucosamine--fructose-6-phosphate aminotransferase [compost metagenome]
MKAYGAHVVIITSHASEETAFADVVFEVGLPEISDEARSILYLPLLQYYGFYTAIKKGLDPDNPRNLTQVVKI